MMGIKHHSLSIRRKAIEDLKTSSVCTAQTSSPHNNSKDGSKDESEAAGRKSPSCWDLMSDNEFDMSTGKLGVKWNFGPRARGVYEVP